MDLECAEAMLASAYHRPFLNRSNDSIMTKHFLEEFLKFNILIRKQRYNVVPHGKYLSTK